MGMEDEIWAQKELGWMNPNKWVCCDCVGKEDFLCQLIKNNTVSNTCSYCHCDDCLVAPLSVLMDAVLRAVKCNFEDPIVAGHPYDSEMPIEYQHSKDVLKVVLDAHDLHWSDELVADVAGSFVNTGWVEAARGEWMGSHGYELYCWSWDRFVETVKYRSRFHFHMDSSTTACGDASISTGEMLGFLGQVFESCNMVQHIESETTLLRARRGAWPLVAAEAGPPLREKATAGRMNPAGIPYLYTAFDLRTALAEVRAVVAEQVTLSQWQPTRELRVLDLTCQLKCMSIFEGYEPKQDHVIFLDHFVSAIQKQLSEKDKSDIEYVPTQLVCEYLAQVYMSGGRPLDGLIYPSALTGGKNLVLFPDKNKRHARSTLDRFGMVAFQSAEVIEVS